MGYNKLILIGNLGRDVDLRTTSSGVSVADFSIAVTQNKETVWFKVSVWRDLAERCNTYLKKGDPVLVEGPLSMETWTDREGKTQTTLVVTAREVQFLKAKDSEETSERKEKEAEVIAEPAKATKETKAKSSNDDIPF